MKKLNVKFFVPCTMCNLGNVQESQTVSTYIKSCKGELQMDSCVYAPKCKSLLEDTIERARKIQHIVILFLIMKNKCKQLKIKRVERGQVSSITNEFIFKGYTLYFHERQNLWGLYFPNHAKPLYTNNIIDMLVYIVENTTCTNQQENETS